MQRKIFIQFFGAGLVVAAGSANAIIGDHVVSVRPANAPSVCQITVDQADMTEICTGTLYSPTQIITAGHCFGRYFSLRNQSLTVRCGGRYAGSVKAVNLPNPHDDSLWLSDKEPARAADVATIELNQALLGASGYAKTLDAYFGPDTRPLPGVKCKIMGFGVDASGEPNGLNEADVSDLTLTYVDQDRGSTRGKLIYLSPNGTAYLPTSADHGDSGGPLFCELPGAAAYELVGVIGGYSFDGTDSNRSWNFMNPVWLHLK